MSHPGAMKVHLVGNGSSSGAMEAYPIFTVLYRLNHHGGSRGKYIDSTWSHKVYNGASFEDSEGSS